MARTRSQYLNCRKLTSKDDRPVGMKKALGLDAVFEKERVSF